MLRSAVRAAARPGRGKVALATRRIAAASLAGSASIRTSSTQPLSRRKCLAAAAAAAAAARGGGHRGRGAAAEPLQCEPGGRRTGRVAAGLRHASSCTGASSAAWPVRAADVGALSWAPLTLQGERVVSPADRDIAAEPAARRRLLGRGSTRCRSPSCAAATRGCCRSWWRRTRSTTASRSALVSRRSPLRCHRKARAPRCSQVRRALLHAERRVLRRTRRAPTAPRSSRRRRPARRRAVGARRRTRDAARRERRRRERRRERRR